jgi:hypothetical protein
MEFIFEVSSRLKEEQDENFQALKDIFVGYKESSDSKDIAAPSRHEQETAESLEPLMGRDRFFKNPKEARVNELYHVHTYEERSEWEDEDGDMICQWDCTSDNYLIYSYFKHENVHHYYIIAFLDKNAHQRTRDLVDDEAHPIVMEWLEESILYRESIIRT